jgi:deazaflavin-dependent oxidoreductase (nitroreductase family)
VAWSWQWKIWNQFTTVHEHVYRASRGRIGGRLPNGAPMLLLHHLGRRSGKWRTCPLLYIPDDEDMVVVASKGGSHKHPDWFLNLKAMDETTVEVFGRTVPVSVKVASPSQRERLWKRAVELYRYYDNYQRRTDRKIPLVILSPIENEEAA